MYGMETPYTLLCNCNLAVQGILEQHEEQSYS